MDFISKTVVKELAMKRGISIERMNEIQAAPYEFLRHVMSNEVDRKSLTFPSVRIIGLGIFHCPDYVAEKFKKVNDDL